MSTIAPAEQLEVAPAAPRAAGLARERVLTWCITCAPVFTLLLFGGIILAGWLPPPSPSQSAAEVKAMYLDHTDLKRLGFTLIFIGGGLTAPVVVAISSQLERIPGARPLSVLQLIGGGLGVLAVCLPALVFLAAAFRPERPADVTQAIHDVAFIPFIGNYVPAVIQAVAIGLAVLMQRGPVTVLPRWFGYLNLWMALVFLPGTFLWFFRSGALAWNGAVCFWIVAVAFGAWFWVIYFVLRKAIREEAA